MFDKNDKQSLFTRLKLEGLQKIHNNLQDMEKINDAFKKREVLYQIIDGKKNPLTLDEAIKLNVFDANHQLDLSVLKEKDLQLNPPRTDWLGQDINTLYAHDQRQLILLEAIVWDVAADMNRIIKDEGKKVADAMEDIFPPDAFVVPPKHKQKYAELEALQQDLIILGKEFQKSYIADVQHIGLDINADIVRPKPGFLESIEKEILKITADQRSVATHTESSSPNDERIDLLSKLNEQYKMIKGKPNSFLGKVYTHYSDEQKKEIKGLQEAFLITLKDIEPEHRQHDLIQALLEDKRGIANSGQKMGSFHQNLRSLMNAHQKLSKGASLP